MKDSVIHKLTLLDTAMYRAMGLNDSPQKYRKEPIQFRRKLYEIYSKLELQDLEELLKIKQGK
jgi:hypothetical protein